MRDHVHRASTRREDDATRAHRIATGARLSQPATFISFRPSCSDPVDQPARRELTRRAASPPCALDARPARLPRAPVRRAVRRPRGPADVLVIMVDEMRAPRWFTAGRDTRAGCCRTSPRCSAAPSASSPHFTASNDCTPSRGALVTGLYSHQTGCLVTGRSVLDAGLPDLGHGAARARLPHDLVGQVAPLERAGTLEPWGFVRRHVPVAQRRARIRARPPTRTSRRSSSAGSTPPAATARGARRCRSSTRTTSSGGGRYTQHVAGERSAPAVFTDAARQLRDAGRADPRAASRGCSCSLQDVAAAGFGAVPFTGRAAVEHWCAAARPLPALQRDVDAQIGRVLATLARRPAVARDTIIAVHLRPRRVRRLARPARQGRRRLRRGHPGAAVVQRPARRADARGPTCRGAQLTSSVDIAPLLLTIASGSSAWRREPRYAHLARRADLAAICADPARAGRRATSSTRPTRSRPSSARSPTRPSAPRHVIAVRTAAAKYAIYSQLARPARSRSSPATRTASCTTTRTRSGRLELDNVARAQRVEEPMARLLAEEALPRELRAAAAGVPARCPGPGTPRLPSPSATSSTPRPSAISHAASRAMAPASRA